jgi:hypothetical protein
MAYRRRSGRHFHSVASRPPVELLMGRRTSEPHPEVSCSGYQQRNEDRRRDWFAGSQFAVRSTGALCDRAGGRENEVRATAYQRAILLICPTGKSVSLLIFCLASFAKIFRFPRRANHLYTLAPSRPTQGRLAIVTDAGRDAMDAGAPSDERRGRER